MFGNEHFSEILMTFAVSVFILAACVGIALGVGLNVSSARTLRFLKATNRRVSIRKQINRLETPHDIDKAIFKRRRSSASLFIVGGAYTVFMMLFVIDLPYVIFALSVYAHPVIVEILVESLRWLLLLSGALALFVGVMMLVSANTLEKLRVRLDRWYDTGNFTKSAGEMHMTLDNLTEAHPRVTGLVLACLSGFALVAAVIVWVNS